MRMNYRIEFTKGRGRVNGTIETVVEGNRNTGGGCGWNIVYMKSY